MFLQLFSISLIKCDYLCVNLCEREQRTYYGGVFGDNSGFLHKKVRCRSLLEVLHQCISSEYLQHMLHKNICCGHSLEVLHQCTSNEYPQNKVFMAK